MTTPNTLLRNDNALEGQLINGPVAPHATLMSSNGYVTREQLASIATPAGTNTHRPIPHHEVINALVDTLGMRKLGVTRDQYAVSKDGNECYWTFDLNAGFPGGNYTLGGRNSHSKKLALSVALGYRVQVCDNGLFPYDAVTRKHTSKVSLQDYLSIGVDHVMRNFDPLAKSIEDWRGQQLSVEQAKLCIYEAYVEERVRIPKHLMLPTHRAYFTPRPEYASDFPPGNVWSMQNAFTLAIGEGLEGISKQQSQAAIGEYFQNRR